MKSNKLIGKGRKCQYLRMFTTILENLASAELGNRKLSARFENQASDACKA